MTVRADIQYWADDPCQVDALVAAIGRSLPPGVACSQGGPGVLVDVQPAADRRSAVLVLDLPCLD